MVIATKNTKDRSGATYISDIDINSITFSALSASALPSKEIIEQERKELISLKLARPEDSGSHDFFMLQQIMNKKVKNKDALLYLSEKDDLRGHLFKYYLTVKGISENLATFNDLLAAEVKQEDELFGQLISTKQMVET